MCLRPTREQAGLWTSLSSVKLYLLCLSLRRFLSYFRHFAVVHPSMNSIWNMLWDKNTVFCLFVCVCVCACVQSPVVSLPVRDTGHFLPTQMSLSLTTNISLAQTNTRRHTDTHTHTHTQRHTFTCLALGCNEHIVIQIPSTTAVEQNHWPQTFHKYQTHTHTHTHRHAPTHNLLWLSRWLGYKVVGYVDSFNCENLNQSRIIILCVWMCTCVRVHVYLWVSASLHEVTKPADCQQSLGCFQPAHATNPIPGSQQTRDVYLKSSATVATKARIQFEPVSKALLLLYSRV